MPKLGKCCVIGCNANSETHRLFNFPKDEKLRNLWLSFLVPVNVQLSGLTKEQLLNRYVCQKHFDRYQFDSMGNRLAHGYPCLLTAKEILYGIPLNSFDEHHLSDHNYSLQSTVADPHKNSILPDGKQKLYWEGNICTGRKFQTWTDQHRNNEPNKSKKAPAASTSTLPTTEQKNNEDDPPEVHSPEDIGRSGLDTPELAEDDDRETDPFTNNKLTGAGSNEIHGIQATKTRKQVLQLRLIDDNNLCDEPIYEVLTDEETEKEVLKPAENAEQNASLQKEDSPTKDNDVQIEAEDASTGEKKDRCAFKNMEYWKLKLKHILHNTKFCGICLDTDGEMNAIHDNFEIIDHERTYRKTLRDIVDKVFKETEYHLANSQICNNCTKKLVQSYIFIYNSEETSKMLNHHLDELYSKTCYVRNNSLKDSNHGQSKIYNVVIALDNKEISENFESTQIKIEMPDMTETEMTEENQQDKSTTSDKRKLKCVSCNMVLPSYRAWKIHERTTHKQTYRCRICLQSYKTQHDLTTHYKMHFKSRCTICHRILQDGELLQHLKKRHKHLIHVCPTCNVAFYSSKAFQRHVNGCHYGDNSKCATCLESLSQAELESHQCRFKCPECVEVPCVHHKYLECYREQMLNLATRAKCLDCCYVCTSKETLIAHVNRQHLKLQPHSCDTCGHKFYCLSDLNKHMCTSEKINDYTHGCQYCDKEFSNLYFYKRHVKSCERIQRKFQCEDCPANFDSLKDQMKHRKHKHGKDIFSCSWCDRVFLNDLKRKSHEMQAHNIQKKNNLDCVVCQAKFPSRAALELHMRYHGPDPKYSCRVCNSRFYTLRQFKAHKHEHRRSFTMCEVCGKVISRIFFKKHITAHLDATVSCKTCGKPFQNLALLRCHQKVHLKSVPCPKCKKMISSIKLWRHFRNHLIRESLDIKVASVHGL